MAGTEREPAYAEATRALARDPKRAHALRIADVALTCCGYVVYPALLAYLAIFQRWLMPACIIIPALCFGFITLLRMSVSEERPYEKGLPNVLEKDTHGKSFPSRHVASMFAIASSWLLVSEPVGLALCIAGCAMGIIRVLGGAHYPRDVIAGAIFAFAFCAIGYAIAYAL